MKRVGALLTCLLTICLAVGLAFAKEPQISAKDAALKLLGHFTDAEYKEIVGTVEPLALLEALKAYEQGPEKIQRWRSHAVVWQIAKTLTNRRDVRQEATAILVQDCKNDEEWQHASRWLLSFTSEDFTSATRAELHKLLADEETARRVVLVCGVAGMHEELGRLGELTPNIQSAVVARARLGSKEDLDKIIKAVEKAPKPSESGEIIELLRNLGYTRQLEAINVLQRYLESEERIVPTGTKYGSKIAIYALDILSQALEGFPIKNDKAIYSEDQIIICRKWMREQKKFKIIR